MSNIHSILQACKQRLEASISTPTTDFIAVFVSITDGKDRAKVHIGRGEDFLIAWAEVKKAVLSDPSTILTKDSVWVRVDVVKKCWQTSWKALRLDLAQTKTNYFPYGIAWDASFQCALLAQELQGHACWYTGNINYCTPNENNLRALMNRRFSKMQGWPTEEDLPLWLFTTQAVFTDGHEVFDIQSDGPMAGIRMLETPVKENTVFQAIQHSTDYLARQVQNDGQWQYGWCPCFDRPVPSYNTLRHASSAYALLEGWEVTRRPDHLAAVGRALEKMRKDFIKSFDLGGRPFAYLVDADNEIKLGGNAVALLALTKWASLTGDRQDTALMEKLGEGILRMQDPVTGGFVHVLNYPTLGLKERTRTVYYDGEAAFGLLRLYSLTKDQRWLDAVERAVHHFIAAEHWRAHDHWLGYCINELISIKPETLYLQFGLNNVKNHLSFVMKRQTTYPTLLELMMSAQRMIDKADQSPTLHSLVNSQIDRNIFFKALHYRARYLFNGYFFPELAMFFSKPSKIVNTFFIRHYSFRVRIDDVQHYLSGLIAYRQYLSGKSTMIAHG